MATSNRCAAPLAGPIPAQGFRCSHSTKIGATTPKRKQGKATANQDRVGRLFQQVSGNQKAYKVLDDRLLFVDPADQTKAVRLDAGGVTTATTRVVTLPDYDVTLGSGVGGLKTVVDTGGAFATPIVLTAADSGKIYLLDDAAGLDFTLPALAAAQVGTNYTFFVTVTNTSNSYRFTAQTGDVLHGHVLISDFDAAYTAPQILMADANGSSHLVITMAAIAQGGGKGGWFDITAISATGWFVRGLLNGDGTIVTVFS